MVYVPRIKGLREDIFIKKDNRLWYKKRNIENCIYYDEKEKKIRDLISNLNDFSRKNELRRYFTDNFNSLTKYELNYFCLTFENVYKMNRYLIKKDLLPNYD